MLLGAGVVGLFVNNNDDNNVATGPSATTSTEVPATTAGTTATTVATAGTTATTVATTTAPTTAGTAATTVPATTATTTASGGTATTVAGSGLGTGGSGQVGGQPLATSGPLTTFLPGVLALLGAAVTRQFRRRAARP